MFWVVRLARALRRVSGTGSRRLPTSRILSGELCIISMTPPYAKGGSNYPNLTWALKARQYERRVQLSARATPEARTSRRRMLLRQDRLRHGDGDDPQLLQEPGLAKAVPSGPVVAVEPCGSTGNPVNDHENRIRWSSFVQLHEEVFLRVSEANPHPSNVRGLALHKLHTKLHETWGWNDKK